MINVPKEKTEIRRSMKAVLGSLDARWERAASNRITSIINKELSSALFEGRSNVLLYLPAFSGEVDVRSIISHQIDQKEIYLPRVESDMTMNFVSISNEWSASLEEGPWHTLQPKKGSGKEFVRSLAPSTVAIVPGLAFSQAGMRLGRGKGCYDRFLCRQGMHSILKIGVSFSFQVLAEVPVESLDVSVDYLCDENGLRKVF